VKEAEVIAQLTSRPNVNEKVAKCHKRNKRERERGRERERERERERYDRQCTLTDIISFRMTILKNKNYVIMLERYKITMKKEDMSKQEYRRKWDK